MWVVGLGWKAFVAKEGRNTSLDGRLSNDAHNSDSKGITRGILKLALSSTLRWVGRAGNTAGGQNPRALAELDDDGDGDDGAQAGEDGHATLDLRRVLATHLQRSDTSVPRAGVRVCHVEA